MVNISCIILTYDSYKFKGGCVETALESILTQNFDDFELVVVDNSPNPEQAYLELLEKRGINSEIIQTRNISRSGARNAGASISRGGTLIFMDDDSIICHENTFSKIKTFSSSYSYGYGAKRFWSYPPKYFEREKRNYSQKIKNHEYSWLLDTERAFLPMGIERATGLKDLQCFTFPGNFGFVSRSLFSQVGGFNEEFTHYGREDDYLAYRLYRTHPSGFVCLYDEVDILHINHPFLGSQDNMARESAITSSVYERLLKKDGVKSFNINLLFGIRNDISEEVIEGCHEYENLY